MVLGFCLSIYCKEKYCNITIYCSDFSIREVNCSIRVFRSFAIDVYQVVTYSSAKLLNAVNLATIKTKKCYQET